MAGNYIRETWGADFLLYLATLVGQIPNHRFRKWFYRHILKIRFGEDTSFHWRTRFFAPWGIKVGNNTIIGNDCFLDGRLGLEIGNNVNISGHIHIYTMQHDVQSPDFAGVGGAVIIEDYVWIATRSIILPGVKIGQGAVVATGAIVTRDVEPYTIVGGIPAKKIGERTKDLRYKLKYHKPFQ